MTEVTRPAENEPKDVSCAEDPMTGEVTDQEKEEKPYDVTTDDDTRVSTFKATLAWERHRDVDSFF